MQTLSSAAMQVLTSFSQNHRVSQIDGINQERRLIKVKINVIKWKMAEKNGKRKLSLQVL
jgi:hypothetical protein